MCLPDCIGWWIKTVCAMLAGMALIYFIKLQYLYIDGNQSSWWDIITNSDFWTPEKYFWVSFAIALLIIFILFVIYAFFFYYYELVSDSTRDYCTMLCPNCSQACCTSTTDQINDINKIQ